MWGKRQSQSPGSQRSRDYGLDLSIKRCLSYTSAVTGPLSSLGTNLYQLDEFLSITHPLRSNSPTPPTLTPAFSLKDIPTHPVSWVTKYDTWLCPGGPLLLFLYMLDFSIFSWNTTGIKVSVSGSSLAMFFSA